MPREIELTLEALLAERNMTQAQLAKRIGVSKGTVSAYCGNSWTVLDRTVLERMADVLRCDTGDLLMSHETSFFDPLRKQEPTCFYLRRPDAKRMNMGRPVGQRDNSAMGHVVKLMENTVVGMVSVEDFVTTPSEFEERAQNNCVVLGSPMVNKATEMALCRVFGAQAFDPAQVDQLPFQFRVAALLENLPASSILQPAEKQGIWLRDERELLQPDTWSHDEFYAKEIKKARDYGIIVVSNHRGVDNGETRKLIVLSGFRGVGTEAAAIALADHYRDLEPRESECHVWGAIEALYNKLENNIHREFLSYRWRYREGGRCPVAFTFRKPKV